MGSLRLLLEKIYSPIMVNEILKQNGDELKSRSDIIKSLMTHGQIRQSKCRICLNPSHQDFPGWVGKMSYKNKKIINKDIVIIGSEVSNENSLRKAINKNYKPLKWSFVHIWYELGFYSDVKLLKSKQALWKCMDLIMDLSNNLDRIYGTDLAKCYTDDKFLRKTRNECSKNYFTKELNCFNDNLNLVFIGKAVKEKLKNYLRLLPNDTFLKFLDDNRKEFERQFNIKPTQFGEYLFEIGKFYSRSDNLDNIKGKYIALPHNAN
ncbi:hypothetical protein LCGC14_1886560 [marine sediment metagenome]|uniref:Uncharacterized protein n=1 Tax=marine sediment metagenome TaxID=412755 RepID=A0A0F9IEP0_9ZZZZ